MNNIAVIAGARPNFMKVAPIVAELESRGVRPHLIHTGQHYDQAMSGSIFTDLGLRQPDANLEVGSGTHAVQTARVMERFDAWLDLNPVDTVVVVGDVNSSMACSLVAVKRGIKVAHVEAGLRSFDRSMPEETNRLVIDALADWLLTPSADADTNLRVEGVAEERIVRVGNVMADSLFSAVERSRLSTVLVDSEITGRYGLVTLHRPALVDNKELLTSVFTALSEVAQSVPLLYPVHPRTRQNIASFGISVPENIRLVAPLGYLDFVFAESHAAVVLTDSGGVQEETTMLGVPCITLRENTERPITISEGTNVLVGYSPERVVEEAKRALAGSFEAKRPDLWDGKAAQRICDVLLSA